MSDACSQKYVIVISLSAQIRIVNSPLNYCLSSAPRWLLDINVYVTDSLASESRQTLRMIITSSPCPMEKARS